ncbi:MULTISPECIES: DUF5977 domain-containing protein [Chitinophagaceae]
MKIILLLFALMASASSYGQSTNGTATPDMNAHSSIGDNSVVPLSPDAASLYKYTGTPVSLMTGTPDIGIPVYTVKTGSLSFPVSLSYHASGIKVNQRSTWVGLGWNLSSSNVISREVRGLPDETTGAASGWFNSAVSTYVYDSILANAGSHANNVLADYLYCQQLVTGQIADTHPDIFSYSLPGKSGKFIYFKSQKRFKTFPYEPVKIDVSTLTGAGTFTVTDDDGSSYYFTLGQSYTDDRGVNGFVQSWYLTRIVSGDRIDTITFNYNTQNPGTGTFGDPIESFAQTYCLGQNTNGIYSPGNPSSDPQNWGIPTGNGQEHVSRIGRHSFVQLSSIVFRGGKLVFYATGVRKDDAGGALDSIVLYDTKNGGLLRSRLFNFRYDYFPGINASDSSYLNYRLRLLSFSQRDVGSPSEQKFSFSYNPMLLPAVNSYSVDYWGYYNNASNYTLLPNIVPDFPATASNYQYATVGTANRKCNPDALQMGLLQKVVYPTGGYSDFVFESNKFMSKSTVTQQQPVNAGTVQVDGTSIKLPVTKTVNFTLPAKLINTGGIVTVTFAAHASVAKAQTLTLTDLTANTQIGYWSHTGNVTVDQTYTQSLNFDSTHTYQFTGTAADVTTRSVYAYATFTQRKTDSSALVQYGKGLHVSAISNYEKDGRLLTRQVYKYGQKEDGMGIVPSADPADNIIASSYTTMGYGVLEDMEMGTGQIGNSTIRKYVASNAYQSIGYSGSSMLFDVATQYNMDSTGVFNGKTVYQYNVPTDNIVIKNDQAVGGYEWIDNSLYDNQLAAQTTYRYDAATKSFTLVQGDQYKYELHTFGGEVGANLTSRKIYIPQGKTLSDPVLQDLLSDFGCQYYTIVSGAYRKSQLTHTERDPGGSTTVSNTYYEYGTDSTLYPVRVTSDDSKSGVFRRRFLYPGNQASSEPDNAVLNQLVARNDLRTPYSQTDSLNNSVLNVRRTYYTAGWNGNNNLVRRSKVSFQTGNAGSTVYNYNSYDGYGNIQEQQKSGDAKEVYIWGYGGMFPVAKVVGSDYSTVVGKLVLATVNSPATDDVTMLAELDKVRRGIPTAQVWSYAYRPLVGMTSSVDPSGKTTYYEYDGLGRVACMKDQEHNIVKTFGYNYVTAGGNTATYLSAAKAATFTVNSCAGGSLVGDAVVYTVPAGRYSSTLSQADADQLAQFDLSANGQAYANANGTCRAQVTTSNIGLQGGAVPGVLTFIGSNNSTYTIGGSGSGNTLMLPADTYALAFNTPGTNAMIDVNGLSQKVVNMPSGGQVPLGSYSVNGPFLVSGTTSYYSNTARSQAFVRNDCASGLVGTSVTYSVPAGTYFSSVSQADADQQALDAVTANGQAYANATGTCSAVVSVTLQKVTSVAGYDPVSVQFVSLGTTYDFPTTSTGSTIFNVPAGTYQLKFTLPATTPYSVPFTLNGQTIATISSGLTATANATFTVGTNYTIKTTIGR